MATKKTRAQLLNATLTIPAATQAEARDLIVGRLPQLARYATLRDFLASFTDWSFTFNEAGDLIGATCDERADAEMLADYLTLLAPFAREGGVVVMRFGHEVETRVIIGGRVQLYYHSERASK